ncbi:tRNA (adenosine(37)-N6)-dimethylallyltransferase MiaA [Tropicibacter sp. R16_0]|uniref:tRNA (adenosine(37)-N6)-dimethylallyltransferase MiaA n=1 Tax=Tropicibacter sp. R16_0 TaxID=2821102 RepID=UPI001ADD485B|nr:tRNA (adenosine(37)-N6)-dimethylallyltransferase MiaA [Tropicibacter sp. R16_0]MBO9449433.1 tRNA (adenosine(37)-N6)-dimethylallyltransferase MiaA [Tropicibacter sp. R16_0]
MSLLGQLPPIPDNRPILIAGPTASGKSALALEIAAQHGGVIINADASQIYDCWRIITACPSAEEEAQAPHRLYRHIPYDAHYSAGHWLREVTPYLTGPERPIIVGGTGLYFNTLIQGMAQIPATPPEVRERADQMTRESLLAELDLETTARIDTLNRARVQRAWEVLTATGRPLAAWQDETPPPLLPLEQTVPVVFDVDKDWLNDRIARRFDLMLDMGALDEVEAMRDRYDPTLPSCKAIGVPELMAYLTGDMTLDEARERATIATRQFAKRQRTWFRARMKDWIRISP